MNANLLDQPAISTFYVEDPQRFKQKAMNWARQFEVACLLDNNEYGDYLHHSHEFLLAVGSEEELVHYVDSGQGTAFERLKDWARKQEGWMFGMLGYDLKNESEKLHSAHFDGIGFPDLHFFRPRMVLELKGQCLEIYSEEKAYEVFEKISSEVCFQAHLPTSPITVQPRISKEEYLNTIGKIHKRILQGDIYEMNFCQEFFAEQVQIDPLSMFSRLNERSNAPFSAYYRLRDRYLLCASPERFLKKEGQKIISQPIKGTIKRGETEEEDLLLKNELGRSDKDRSENVMIVDLVRNDLGKSCKAGTVKVEELFGLYGFNQVWQMISTVTGELAEGVDGIDAIREAFPMGSMTGAPKVRSMQLIEEYEQSKRGLYSGAVGYIRPDGDFDFNVVIRSLLYNAADQYLSFQVGGAIVFDSLAEKEYEECLLKAKGILGVLEHV